MTTEAGTIFGGADGSRATMQVAYPAGVVNLPDPTLIVAEETQLRRVPLTGTTSTFVSSLSNAGRIALDSNEGKLYAVAVRALHRAVGASPPTSKGKPAPKPQVFEMQGSLGTFSQSIAARLSVSLNVDVRGKVHFRSHLTRYTPVRTSHGKPDD